MIRWRVMQCCRRLRSWWLVCGGLMLCGVAAANCMSGPAPTTPGEPRDVAEWVARMHHASLFRSYRGTFVVLSSNGAMVSSRIWHACEGARQIERVEALSGTPRVVFRREEEVRTFLPHARVVRSELRDVPVLFRVLPMPRVSILRSITHCGRLGRSAWPGGMPIGFYSSPVTPGDSATRSGWIVCLDWLSRCRPWTAKVGSWSRRHFRN